MPLTPRVKIPYPNENQDPWYDRFVQMVNTLDAALFATWEDRNIFVLGGGVVTWNSGTNTLSWAGALEITASVVGFLWTIEPGSLTINDGQFVYFQAVRSPTSSTTVVLVAGTKVPNTNIENPINSVMMFIRRGARLYGRGGKVLQNGDAVQLYEVLSPGAGAPVGPATPSTVQAGATAVVGVSAWSSHEDHVHAVDTGLVGDVAATGTAAAAGVLTRLSRADHVHRTAVRVQQAGALVSTRPIVNFVRGVVADNGVDDRADVTIGFGSTGQYLLAMIPLALGLNTDSNVDVIAGGTSLDVTEYTLLGLTTTFRFAATAYITGAALTGTVELFNLTDLVSVHTFSFTGAPATSPTTQEAVVAVAGNKIYEVRYKVTGGAGPADRVYVMSAAVKVRQTF